MNTKTELEYGIYYTEDMSDPTDENIQHHTIKTMMEMVNDDAVYTYNQYDILDGLLSIGYGIVLPRGTKMYWNDPDNGECSGWTTIMNDVNAESTDTTIVTERGDIPLSELTFVKIPSKQERLKVLVKELKEKNELFNFCDKGDEIWNLINEIGYIANED